MKKFFRNIRSERAQKWVMRGTFLAGFVTLIAASGIGQLIAQQGFYLVQGTIQEAHQLVGGIPPTATNSTVSPGSTDMAGKITLTSTNKSAVVTFAKAFTVTPFCVVTDNGEAEGLGAIITVSSLTISGGSGTADVISWICLGTVNN